MAFMFHTGLILVNYRDVYGNIEFFMEPLSLGSIFSCLNLLTLRGGSCRLN
jgi:hypothetical protein